MAKTPKNGFSLEEDGLRYSGPDGRELYFPFSERLRLTFSPWTGKLKVKGPDGNAALSALPEAEQLPFLLELLQRWRERNPEGAKKAAFDYVDGQKGFVPLAFVACLFFCLPMAVGLLADSIGQFRCSSVLREGTTVGTMTVVKAKKKSKQDYLLDLEFTTPDGRVIKGHDQLIVQDETKIPKQVPVVYSPTQPDCWSLPPNLTGKEVNWAQRRYFGFFSLFTGIFFLLFALWGILWSVGRWKRKRPFRAEVARAFQL